MTPIDTIRAALNLAIDRLDISDCEGEEREHIATMQAAITALDAMEPRSAVKSRLAGPLRQDGHILRVAADGYFLADIARGMNDREEHARILVELWNAWRK